MSENNFIKIVFLARINEAKKLCSVQYILQCFDECLIYDKCLVIMSCLQYCFHATGCSQTIILKPKLFTYLHFLSANNSFRSLQFYYVLYCKVVLIKNLTLYIPITAIIQFFELKEIRITNFEFRTDYLLHIVLSISKALYIIILSQPRVESARVLKQPPTV